MKRILLFAASLTASLLAAGLCHVPSAEAREAHQHRHEHSGQLGRVNFPVSCNAEARTRFNRAAAWLHSFEYEEAEKAFAKVTAADPRCAMGHRGVAMSNYHPIWASPGAAELKKGREAVERAASVGARTRRERDYVAAIRTFYKDSDKLDHRTRALAYGDAMGQLYRRYPSGREAGVFYAPHILYARDWGRAQATRPLRAARSRVRPTYARRLPKSKAIMTGPNRSR